MGLDQFLYKKKKNKNNDSNVIYIKDIQESENSSEYEEIGYWRKHSDLQGYMENLYSARGGTKEFNCEKLKLSKDDIEKVIEYAKNELKKYNNNIPIEHVAGFFFGETEKSDWEETIEIFEKALKEVNFDEYEIFYDSWW